MIRWLGVALGMCLFLVGAISAVGEGLGVGQFPSTRLQQQSIEEALQDQDWNVAADMLEGYLQLRPGNPKLWLDLAELKWRANRPGKEVAEALAAMEFTRAADDHRWPLRIDLLSAQLDLVRGGQP